MFEIDPIVIGYTSPAGIPGADDTLLTEPVTLSHKDFEETHIHGIGATRSGKSKWLEGFCRELIDQRFGFTLIDPQGALAESLVQYLAFYRPRQPVIYFNPSRTDYLIPFVPWRTRYMSYSDHEQRAVVSVLVSKFVETVLRVWGVENSNDTPRLERWLTSLGYLLVGGVVAMNEVSVVLTWTEADVRRYVADRLTDTKSVQNEWRELLDYKRVIDFSNQIESVRNRLRRFYEPLQIQRITSIDDRTLDFRTIFEQGVIVIANLCDTDFFSQEHARLIGTMMVNELWGAARRPHKPVSPYFLLIDEVERFVTPDLADILDRGAGKGLHLGVFHQRLGQLRRRDEALYDAIMVNAKTKLVFGGLTFDAALTMVKELFVNQIDYAEAKIMIEQTKFWPRYDRDTVYMESDGEGDTDMTGAAAGFVTGSGSGMSWDTDALAFFTLPEHARLSEHDSNAEHQSDMRSSARSRMRTSGRADVPIYRPEPFKEVSSITPYSLEEHWTRLAHNLMEQYQRHYFIKRRNRAAIAAVTPSIEEFRIFPRREQEYILEKLIKPYALQVEEIDQMLADRLERLQHRARLSIEPATEKQKQEQAGPTRAASKPAPPRNSKQLLIPEVRPSANADGPDDVYEPTNQDFLEPYHGYNEGTIPMAPRRDDSTPNLRGGKHRMTPRGQCIRTLLEEYRLMRSTHLIEFLKYYFSEDLSEQTTTRYLRWLMDEKEIIRISRDPDSHMVAKGSLPKIYGMYNEANKAIDERKDKPSFVVPHALDVATTIAFGVVRACRESKGMMRFIDAPDILQSMGSAQAKTAAKPFTWPVQVFYRNEMHKCTITPDRLFSIYFTAIAHHWFFVLEEDRSTEPHERNDYSFNAGTSLFRKFLTYCFAHHMHVPLQLYNINGFRILFVTDSPDRIKHVLEVWKLANDALKEFQKQSGIAVRPVANNVLLCVDRPTLRAGTIFTVPWINGRGDQVTLDLPPSAAP